jgi:dTMP kinase
MAAWASNLRARFLVFDGPDGSGKSTQIERFVRWCGEQGVSVAEVREPGGTAIGEQVRNVLLDPANTSMSLRCEMLLYMASRAQLVEERIRPALAQGRLVLADRYISSTLAYQGTAGGLPREDILAVGRVAVEEVWPDLTVIFDVDEATAAGRLNPLLDRVEQKGAAFHRRVREGFLEQARRDPGHHEVIDAALDADGVFRLLLASLERRFGGR